MVGMGQKTPMWAEGPEIAGHPDLQVPYQAQHLQQQGGHGEDVVPHLQQ